MQIGIIGGLERNEPALQRAALVAGHFLEFHRGDMAGRRTQALDSLIQRSDLIVIVTDVNSHGAVIEARKTARRLGVRTLLVRRFGVAKLDQLIDALKASQNVSSGQQATALAS